MSDDIYEAIFWHTTGKADMTLLEKLLYIADYMEPTRDFRGGAPAGAGRMRIWTRRYRGAR